MGLNPSLLGGPERTAHPAKGAMTEANETTAPLLETPFLKFQLPRECCDLKIGYCLPSR
jgi:hypothetical protein